MTAPFLIEVLGPAHARTEFASGVEALDRYFREQIRLYRPDGSLVPTEAEAERQRADAAEAEIARLRALLEERGRG